MKHQVITLPEHHEHYPYLWQSECGTYRIIRCCDDYSVHLSADGAHPSGAL